MADTIAGDAFADVNQLEAGWHPLLGDERARATELLARHQNHQRRLPEMEALRASQSGHLR